MAKKGTFNATIVSENFTRAAKDFAKKLGADDFEKLIEQEVVAVLGAAARRTGIATAKKIRAQNKAEPTRITGWYTLPDGTPAKRSWRVSDAQWRSYVKKKRAEMKENLARIGLARQAWLQIASDLGLKQPTKGVVKASKAKVSGRVINHRVSGKRIRKGRKRFGIEVTYSNPVGRHTDARTALTSTISRRAKAFRKTMELGAEERAKRVAKNYPGIKFSKL